MVKPTLRPDTEIDLVSAIKLAVIREIENQRFHPYRNCLTCMAFNEKDEICKTYARRPPARVIVFGCPSYDDMNLVQY